MRHDIHLGKVGEGRESWETKRSGKLEENVNQRTFRKFKGFSI